MDPWREVRPAPIHVRQFAYMTRGDAGRESFRVPGWGYFEGFEAIVPEPIPAYDQGALIEIALEVTMNGQPVGQLKVHTLHRSVW